MPFLSPAIAAARGRKLITNNLQVYYDPRQSVSGTTYTDVAPDANNFNLSLNNGVDTTNASNGYITFDGVNDEAMSNTTQTSGYLDLGTYQTLSGWFKLKTLPPLGTVSRVAHTFRQTDYGGGNIQNTNGVWIDFFHYSSPNKYFGGGGWCNDGSNGGSTTYFGLNTFTYSLNVWYFVSITKDNIDYTVTAVDSSTGNLYSRTVAMASPKFTEDANNSDTKWMNLGAVFGAVPSHADVGEVMFYTSALTESEIYNNYIATKNDYL